MNKRVKTKWVKALRSGKYEQGKGALNSGDGKWCCLGILTDLYIKEKGGKWKTMKGENCTFRKESELPPICVMKWAGLPDRNPDVSIKGKSDTISLATLNDGDKDDSVRSRNFTKIANLIEKQL